MLIYGRHDITIISGGQTGVDIAGLEAAKSFKIKTGGWAPLGWQTLVGPQQELLESYGLKEHSGGYSKRTKQNIIDSNITLIIARNWKSAGTLLTMRVARELNKPFIAMREDGSPVEAFGFSDDVKKKLSVMNILDEMNVMQDRFKLIADVIVNYPVINCAGNAEQNAPGIETEAYNLFYEIFMRISK